MLALVEAFTLALVEACTLAPVEGCTLAPVSIAVPDRHYPSLWKFSKNWAMNMKPL